MVLGVGIDLLEVARMERALSRHHGSFELRVFTAAEREACTPRADRCQAFAARFAAKEAVMKALGTGWSGGIGFHEIEIARQESGRPVVALHGRAAELAAERGVRAIHVSLTHQRGMAAAVAVLEG